MFNNKYHLISTTESLISTTESLISTTKSTKLTTWKTQRLINDMKDKRGPQLNNPKPDRVAFHTTQEENNRQDKTR